MRCSAASRTNGRWSRSGRTYPIRSPSAPARGSRLDRLSWWTCFDADHFLLLAPVVAGLGADVRRTPGGAAVVGLLPGPAAVDELRFARLNGEYRRFAPERSR